MNHHHDPSEPQPLSDFSELRDRVGRLEEKLEHNTNATERIESRLGQVWELMQFATTGIGFFAGMGRVFAAIGRAMRRFVIWIMPFLTLLGAVWAIFHGKWPDKP